LLLELEQSHVDWLTVFRDQTEHAVTDWCCSRNSSRCRQENSILKAATIVDLPISATHSDRNSTYSQRANPNHYLSPPTVPCVCTTGHVYTSLQLCTNRLPRDSADKQPTHGVSLMDSRLIISPNKPTNWQRTVASYWRWPAMCLGGLTILNVTRELNPRKDRSLELQAARMGWHWVDMKRSSKIKVSETGIAHISYDLYSISR
jgi:hypothetical protein